MADYIYGNYYLNTVQMQYNVDYITAWRKDNWTELTDISYFGLLGNLQQESTINPGLWQNRTVGRGGFGIAQWTPASKLTNWLRPQGLPDYDMVGQLRWIKEYTIPYGQWQRKAYPYNVDFMTWVTYSGDDLTWATVCFEMCWEQAGNAQMQNRIRYAKQWADYVGSDHPIPDPGPWTPPGPDNPAYGCNYHRTPLLYYLRRLNGWHY